MARTENSKNSIGAALIEKRNVMAAVALRDMRTRFFDHGLGFIVVALWPLAHMGALLTIYWSMGRAAPYGESVSVYFATGLIPTLAFMYISRFMSISLLLNKPMMAFPIVTAIDIVMARAFLEITAAALTLFFMLTILTLIGGFPMPNDPLDALCAYLAAILLGVGIGTLVSLLVVFFNFFGTAYALLMILVYISSGTILSVTNFPKQYVEILSWNPVFQCVYWMRVAFYPTYSDEFLDRRYTVLFGLCSLLLGLLLERLFRRRMLEG